MTKAVTSLPIAPLMYALQISLGINVVRAFVTDDSMNFFFSVLVMKKILKITVTKMTLKYLVNSNHLSVGIIYLNITYECNFLVITYLKRVR